MSRVISRNRLDEILREEVVKARQEEIFYSTILRLDECNSKKEQLALLNEVKTNSVLGEGPLDWLMQAVAGGGREDGGSFVSGIRDTWKQSAIEWVLQKLGLVDDPTIRRIIAQVFQNFSFSELMSLAKNPDCNKIEPVISRVISEELGEELVRLIQNTAADNVPLISYFVANSSAGYGNIGGFLSNTLFGAAGENIGDAIRSSPMFKEHVRVNTMELCQDIADALDGFSISDLNPFSE